MESIISILFNLQCHAEHAVLDRIDIIDPIQYAVLSDTRTIERERYYASNSVWIAVQGASDRIECILCLQFCVECRTRHIR